MSKLAAALGALFLLAGTFIVYLNDEVLDPDAAGARASQELADNAELRAAIAPKVEDAVPDPIQDLPLVGGASAGAVEIALAQPVAADAYGNAVSAAVVDLTKDDRPDPVVLNLTDVANGVSSGPLDLVAGQVDVLQIDLTGADRLLDALALADDLEPLGTPLVASGVLLLLLSIVLAGGLGDGILIAGASVGVAAVVGIAVLIISRTLLGGSFDDGQTRDAVVATWDALGGDLMTTFLIAAIAGFVAAIAAWLTMRIWGRPAAVGHPELAGRPGGERRARARPGGARSRRAQGPAQANRRPEPPEPPPDPPAASERFQPTERHERPATDESLQPTERHERPATDERFEPTERHERPVADERFEPTELHERPDRPPPPRDPPPEAQEAPDRTQPTERSDRPPPPPTPSRDT